MLASRGGERLVGALKDPLRADVDPGAGGHLAVHHQALALQIPKMIPRGPAAHQVGVGDEHSGRIAVRTEDADGLAALYQERLVCFQIPQ